ncbi:MAG: hypothetical protein IJK87_14580 [Prevotella sp.]|nr:hypothetical protein [Prevotella sp.]
MSIPRVFTLCLAMVATTLLAQQPMRVEYFLDTDPGYGAAKTVSGITTGDNGFAFDLGDAQPGAHVLYVRCQDTQGQWSATVAHPLFIREKAGQQPMRLEYFLDDDPGYGLAATITGLQVGDNALTFDLSPFKDGAHVLYVRSQDDQGHWSATMSRPLFIDRYQDIVYVEYFFDGEDPGVGKATSVPLPDVEYKGNLSLDLSLDITGLALGDHQLSVRALDRYDQWTDVMTRPFTIVEKKDPDTPDNPVNPPVEEGDLARLEYFFDTDPGYGNGIPLSRPNTGTNTYLMSFEGLAPGAHLLCLRAWDDQNHWSQTLSRPIYVCSVMGTSVTRMEYFLDTDPGYGNARQMTGSVIDLGDTEAGAHVLYLRAQDNQGRWSMVMARPLYVTNKADGSIVAMEYFFDRQDPGEGNATAIPLPANANGRDGIAFEVSIDGLDVGEHQFSIRAKDDEGKWSMVRSEPFTITINDGIAAVTWNMPIGIRMDGATCILTDQGDGSRGDSRVEVYTLSGMTLATAEWPGDVNTLSIPIGNAPKGSVILVKVTAAGNRMKIVRLAR